MRKIGKTFIRTLPALFGVLLSGCQLWPFMSDEDGRRPIAMGKQDQVLYPYNDPPTVLSEDFGQSFRWARENQILNPQASRNLEPVTGMDGKASKEALERYRGLYKKPPYGGESDGGKK